jgi:predicted RNase H-like nuclease (RuvC/YqgF family)
MSKKDAYIEKAQAKIEEYACKLDELKARTKGEVDGMKIDAQQQIDRLEIKLDATRLRLAELTDSAEDKWQDLSGRFEVLADDLGASFRKFFEKH